MDTALLIGYMASVCSVTSFVPQVWKVLKSGDTAAISARMYALTVLGFALWSGFGVLRSEWPIILTNSICFCLSSYILIRKLRAISPQECLENTPDGNTLEHALFADVLSRVGRAEPLIGGSSASLMAAQIGIAMIRMAFAVSKKHGAEIDQSLSWLDVMSSRLNEAAEQDRVATLALIEALRDDLDPADRGRVVTEATLKPLAAAKLLVELVEHLCEEEPHIRQLVASDFLGGVELVNSAFTAVMMAVESNRESENSKYLSVSDDLVELSKRRDIAVANLRSRHHARKTSST